MSIDPALQVFMDETRRRFDEGSDRFDKIEDKLDSELADIKCGIARLYKFRWQISGAWILISVVFSAVIAIATVVVTAAN